MGRVPTRLVKKPVYRPAPSVSTGTRFTQPDRYPTQPDSVDSTASQFKFRFGSENKGFEEAHFYASREEMENLVLDDPLNNGKVVFEPPPSLFADPREFGGVRSSTLASTVSRSPKP